jgi:D-lactate dehydrogenase
MIDDDVLARLMTFPNVLITSHQAFFTREALHNIATTTLNNLQAYFDGRPLINEICTQCTRLRS